MRGFLFLLIGIAPLISHARLGETEEQLQQRFGAPTSRQQERIIAQGKFVELGPVLRFQQNDWHISCLIIEGRCSRESYGKPGEWTEEQLALVLNTNAQGAKWQVTDARSPKLRREWKRDDGATAIWQLGAGFVVAHPAYTRAKQRAEDKAKADASRLPKL